MEKTKAIGISLIIISLIITLHHEFFEAVFLTAGATLLISTYTKQRSENK